MILREAINGYINWKASYTRKAPIDYKKTLSKFYQFTQKDIEDLELSDVLEFGNWLKLRGLSDNTVAHDITIIKNFIKFYREQGIGKIQVAQIRVNKNFLPKSHLPVEAEDFKRMCDELDGRDYADLQKLCCIHLLWWTGMRVSELCDIDVVHVSLGEAVIKNRKNPDFRFITWPKETQGVLQEYLALKSRITNTPALFTGTAIHSNLRITPRTIQRWVKEICQRAGITKKYSPHSFRHGKAHYMKSRGADDTDIAITLGHRSLRSTRTYLQLNQKESLKMLKKYLK